MIMTRHPFDAATEVEPVGPGLFRARAPEDYWAFIGPFGGVTTGSVLGALLAHPDRSGDPVALTINLAAAPKAGPYEIATRLARNNKSSQHWIAEIRQGDDPQPLVTATAILAQRRDSFSHLAVTPPAIPAWDTLKPLPDLPTASWIAQYQFRFAEGGPNWGRTPAETPQSARSVLWLADRVERAVDFKSLASMADAFFGRVFQVRGELVPFGTVSFTTYFHVAGDELAALAATRLVAVADAHSFHRSYCDQFAELWSPGGDLLATTHQVAYFKC
jgi:hypothetical protein